MKRYALSAFAIAFALLGVACAGEAVEQDDVERIEPARANLRIAVVGAGPSGLTAAYDLKNRGYTNVTVFEREARAGGKVRSEQVGPGIVEFGAVFTSQDYVVTKDIADDFGLVPKATTTTRFIFATVPGVGGKKMSPTEFLLSQGYSPTDIVLGAGKYAAVLAKYPQIFDEKLNRLPSDLEMDFDEFVTKHDIGVAADLARALIIGFGYGYYENVPAIYQLKILDMLVKVVPAPEGQGVPAGTPIFASPTFESFDGGFSKVWVAVAASLPNVKLSTTVTKIERDLRPGRPVKVTFGPTPTAPSTTPTTTTTQDFDVVIYSAPLFTAANIINLTTPEKDYIKQMTSSRYVVSLVTALGIQGGEAVFVNDNAFLGDEDRVGVWANPNPAVPIFQTWQIANRGTSEDALNGFLAQDLQTLGGATTVIPALPPGVSGVRRVDWPDYFPRVSAQAMRNGFFDLVEAAQGLGGIYFVGSSMSFETVEHSSAYARRLVQERFRKLN